jgi:hypothetical protein
MMRKVWFWDAVIHQLAVCRFMKHRSKCWSRTTATDPAFELPDRQTRHARMVFAKRLTWVSFECLNGKCTGSNADGCSACQVARLSRSLGFSSRRTNQPLQFQ